MIVDEDHRVLSTGYNGAHPGGPSCLKGECPRGLSDVAPGSSYDTGAGSCVATHAEGNALLFARASVKGATLFCTDTPCDGCMRLIRSAGIARVVSPELLMREYGDDRDPKSVEYNKNLYPVDDPPVCERRGCGHVMSMHWDRENRVHTHCRSGCGCWEPLKP